MKIYIVNCREILGKLVDSGIGAGPYKMYLQHLAVPGGKKVLKNKRIKSQTHSNESV